MSKIMIVDDEIEICEFLGEFFKDRHYDVITASSGIDAIQKVTNENPQILLLDITMPGINGLQVLKEVKMKNPKIKVIMVTATESNDAISEAFRLGADNYITKPLSLEELERDVNEKIENISK